MKTVFCIQIKVHDNLPISNIYLKLFSIFGNKPTHYCYGDNRISQISTSGRFSHARQELLKQINFRDVNWIQIYEKEGKLHYPVFYNSCVSINKYGESDYCLITVTVKGRKDIVDLLNSAIKSLNSIVEIIYAYSFTMAINKLPEFITMGIPVQKVLSDGEIAYVCSLGHHEIKEDYEKFPFIFPYMYLKDVDAKEIEELNIVAKVPTAKGFIVQTSSNMELDNNYKDNANFIAMQRKGIIQFYYDPELFSALKL